MDYMILIHADETAVVPNPGTPEFDEYLGAWTGYNQRLIDGGHWIAGGSLQGTDTATTIRRSAPGTQSVTDGPYTETEEQLGGFYLVRAADLDEALDLAGGIPIPSASIEVRPVKFRPDAA